MKKKITYPAADPAPPAMLRDTPNPTAADERGMVRTQIYLSRLEYDFLQLEAKRRNEPMAAVIRDLIDERMNVPEDAWESNPMLRATPHHDDWKGHEDGALNHDHYIAGSPKQWIKVKGKRVEAPPLPTDYYENPAAAKEYDRQLKRMDETV